MFVYVMFLIWIQIYRKLYFTNLANPKNPNLNLDSTDYGCEIRLMCFNIHQEIIQRKRTGLNSKFLKFTA